RLKLAEGLIEHGDWDRAKEQFDLLRQDNFENPLAHLGLGRVALERGDWMEARHRLKLAAVSPYSRKAAHALLASSYQLQGDAVSMEKELQSVKDLPNDLPWPDPYIDEIVDLRVDKRSRYKKAAELVAVNYLPEAVVALEKLVEEYPDLDIAWRLLGRTQLQMGDLTSAEQSL